MFVRKNIGAWCNGNTWVSKTFVVSSNLTAPAKILEHFVPNGMLYFCAVYSMTFRRILYKRDPFLRRQVYERSVDSDCFLAPQNIIPLQALCFAAPQAEFEHEKYRTVNSAFERRQYPL